MSSGRQLALASLVCHVLPRVPAAVLVTQLPDSCIRCFAAAIATVAAVAYSWAVAVSRRGRPRPSGRQRRGARRGRRALCVKLGRNLNALQAQVSYTTTRQQHTRQPGVGQHDKCMGRCSKSAHLRMCRICSYLLLPWLSLSRWRLYYEMWCVFPELRCACDAHRGVDGQDDDEAPQRQPEEHFAAWAREDARQCWLTDCGRDAGQVCLLTRQLIAGPLQRKPVPII